MVFFYAGSRLVHSNNGGGVMKRRWEVMFHLSRTPILPWPSTTAMNYLPLPWAPWHLLWVLTPNGSSLVRISICQRCWQRGNSRSSTRAWLGGLRITSPVKWLSNLSEVCRNPDLYQQRQISEGEVILYYSVLLLSAFYNTIGTSRLDSVACCVYIYIATSYNTHYCEHSNTCNIIIIVKNVWVFSLLTSSLPFLVWHTEGATEDDLKVLIYEMDMLASIEDHPNIVSLLRVCSVGSE